MIAVMTTNSPGTFESFQWSPHPETSRFLSGIVADFLAACPEAALLAARLSHETGTRFADWMDHIRIDRRDPRVQSLEPSGYRVQREFGACTVYAFDAGLFPALVVWDGPLQVGIKTESVADFLAAHQLQRNVTGNPLAPLRTCDIYSGRDCALTAVERRGTNSLDPQQSSAETTVRQLRHLERFRTRQRQWDRDEDGFEAAHRLIDEAIMDLGPDLTCHLWFEAEREFWLRRNRAGQAQKARQDKLGLGWANHDHHTYRSSRANFTLLIGIWEKLGLKCRERYYAGREAGWGAQVMEQPVTGIVTFNDVDLAPDELAVDFSHEGLREQKSVGTVGLWCGLHGDSFLQAGMHHLAARFDFESLGQQLHEAAGVKMMKPFSDLPHLRQAFTEGERWNVDPSRIERLLRLGKINGAQAGQFQSSGAVGSHLENLQRNDGFKGFHQTGVSDIILATDPRGSLEN